MINIINGPEAGGGQIPIGANDRNTAVVLHGQGNSVTGATMSDVAIIGGDGHNSVRLDYPPGTDAVLLGGDSNFVSVYGGTAFIVTPGQHNDVNAGPGGNGLGPNDQPFVGRFDVAVGSDSTVRLYSATSGSDVVAGGPRDMVFLYSSSAAVDDLGGDLHLSLNPLGYHGIPFRNYVGDVVVRNFQNDPNGLIDLGRVGLGTNVGGYTNFSEVSAALKSDGHGGTTLPLGTTGSIDFVGDAHLTASNFAFG